MEDFVTYCKNYVAEHLGEYEGQKLYFSDLGWAITECPNMDGSLTFSRAKAMDYLKEWWIEAADYFDFEKSEFGNVHNPFDNPEAYMVCMVIEGVRSLIDRAIQAIGLYDKWDEEVELTADLIEKIEESVSEMYVEKLF